MRSHLVILSERDAIAWVVARKRMAFTADRATAASAAIAKGDELFLYATRGAFHNPTRDRGRVFGRATATSDVEQLAAPVVLISRTFTHGFSLRLEVLVRPRLGVEIAELVPLLSSFPNEAGWAWKLRRPFLTLTTDDAQLLRRRLRKRNADDEADFVRLTNNIVDRALADRWAPERKDAAHAKAARIFSAGALRAWVPFLRDALAPTLRIFEQEERKKILYREMDEADFENAGRLIDRLFSHKVWEDPNPPV